METNKAVAAYIAEIFGEAVGVNAHKSEDGGKEIAVLRCANVPQEGVQSCASIGLNGTDIGLVSGGKKLRVEVVGACDVQVDVFENMVASTAYAVMDAGKCYPGFVAENVVGLYVESEMKHVLLTSPFLWNGMETMALEDRYIAWLMMVPVSEAEYAYAKKMGADALEERFAEENIDIYHLYRKSIIE